MARRHCRFSTTSLSNNDGAIVNGKGVEIRTPGVSKIAAGVVAIAAGGAAGLSVECDEEDIFSFPQECLKEDHYNGVTVNVASLPSHLCEDVDLFRKVLEVSLDNWKREGKKGIWIQVPTEYAKLIAPCTTLGFDFQHARKGQMVVTKWLLEDQESRLPLGPTHQVGVGAVVVHPLTKKILVVQEKSGPAAAKKLWKMPTGLTNPGEDITDAAIREIFEETNLKCTFSHIVCFRQAHGGLYQQSDMFFVCHLKLDDCYNELLESGKEIELVPQEEEIAEIKWMTVEEYAEQDVWQGSPLYGEMNEALRRVVTGELGGAFVGKSLDIGYRPGKNTIYGSKL